MAVQKDLFTCRGLRWVHCFSSTLCEPCLVNAPSICPTDRICKYITPEMINFSFWDMSGLPSSAQVTKKPHNLQTVKRQTATPPQILVRFDFCSTANGPTYFPLLTAFSKQLIRQTPEWTLRLTMICTWGVRDLSGREPLNVFISLTV